MDERRARRNASARKWKSASRNSMRRFSSRTVTKKNRSERKGRSRNAGRHGARIQHRRRDEQRSLTTRQAADLKDGGPRYFLAGHLDRQAHGCPLYRAGKGVKHNSRFGGPYDGLRIFGDLRSENVVPQGGTALKLEGRERERFARNKCGQDGRAPRSNIDNFLSMLVR